VPSGVAREVLVVVGHSPCVWKGGAVLGARGGVPRLGAGPTRPGDARGGDLVPSRWMADRRRAAGCALPT
jgi:hypothetical protein